MLELILHNKSALNAQQQKLDTISNNLANMNTVGYKSEETQFSDLVYDSLKRNGYPASSKATGEVVQQNGTGVRATGFLRDETQGSLAQTNQSTDLALDGEGYYKVTRPGGGVAYERSGDFNIDASGRLVDESGNILEVNYSNGFVPLTQNNFTVDTDGTVNLKGDNGLTTKVGNINVYNVVSQNSLSSIGNNLYQLNSGAQVYQVSGTSIQQGYSEQSNVDATKEMTDMIVAQRAFQLSSKSLTTADEMWQMANNLSSK